MDTLELVLRQSNGAILIPLKRAAVLMGREPQTIRNQLNLGKCPLEPVRQGRSVFFHAADIARAIDGGRVTTPRRGRPTKAEQIARQAGDAGPQAEPRGAR